MNAPKKADKTEDAPVRYEADAPARSSFPTSPVPSLGEQGKPFVRPEGDLPVACLDHKRIRQPLGLRARRAEARAAA